MRTIVGIAGSLRRGSLNASLLSAAASMMPSGATLRLGSIAGIPLYDGDLEAREGVPRPVQTLKDQIAASDGLLVVTPEYNHSLPGVLKNGAVSTELSDEQREALDRAIDDALRAFDADREREGGLLASELLAHDPENTFYAYTASNVDSTLVEALIYQDELDQATLVLNRATQEIRRLLDQDANVLEWAVLDSELQISDGKLKVAGHRPDEAIASLAITIAGLKQLAANHPANFEATQLLALAHAVTAEAHGLRGDATEVSTNVESIVGLLDPIEERLPLRYLALLGQASSFAGDPARADAIDTRLQDAGYAHPDKLQLTRE